MSRLRSPARLLYRGDIEIDGQHVFRLRFNQRSGGQFPPDPEDGVSDLSVVDDIRRALLEAYPLLTSQQFGWRPWSDSRPREVAIRDIGPSRYGLAALEGRDLPYLVLSPRAFEATPESVRRRRQTTVVHELVHLLQFGTPLFRHWHGRRTLRHGDPNWWLHEATALATECLIHRNHASAYPRLWRWATRPELSIESDPDGYLAMPLILYLMRRVQPSMVARLYDATPELVETMHAAEVLDHQLRQNGLVLASSRAEEESVFLDYCVDAALLGTEESLLPSQWKEIVGTRTSSEVFHAYPVSHAGKAMPIDHLGSRCFEFTPQENVGQPNLFVQVSPRPEKPNQERSFALALKGELIAIGREGTTIARQRLKQMTNGDLHGVVPSFSESTIQRVMLVLANCAFGPGWAYYDGLQFTVSAQTE